MVLDDEFIKWLFFMTINLNRDNISGLSVHLINLGCHVFLKICVFLLIFTNLQ